MEEGNTDQSSIWPDAWSYAVASGDEMQLSKMVLHWSGSNPETALLLLHRCAVVLAEDYPQFAEATEEAPPSLHSEGPRDDRSLVAFTVALNQVCEGSEWYTCTKELQLASFQLCTVCRDMATLTLRVDESTPRRLVAASTARCRTRDRVRTSDVPRLRAHRVKWNLPTAEKLKRHRHVAICASAIEFGRDFADSLAGIRWPRRLRELEFCPRSRFNTSIAGVAWPVSLQRVTFGDEFNQSLEGVVLPAALLQLIFGDGFNQSIQSVSWPTSLRSLTFGHEFCQPIGGVAWPKSLVHLTFGAFFNQSLQGVALPPSLERLVFGAAFDQPVEGVAWPESLRQLSFGIGFNQPIDEVTWPDRLGQLSFGEDFDQVIDEVTWPPALHSVSFGTVDDFSSRKVFHMSSAFDERLDTARWPTSLRQLTIGGSFRQPLNQLGACIPSLKELTLLPDERMAYWPLLGEMQWPQGLRKLTVYNDAFFEEFPFRETLEIVYLTRDK